MLTPETPEEQLLGLVKKGSKLMMRKGSHAAAPIKGHGEGEAEKMVVLGLDKWGLVDAVGRLIQTRKGDPRKVALATVLKAHTSVGNEWLAQRLDMGHNRSVSRLIRQGNDSKEIRKLCSEFSKMLPCEDWYHFHAVRSRRASLKGSNSPDCFGG